MSKEKENKKLPQVAIEINKDIEAGVYVNQAFIIHSRKEFIIDLGLGLPTGKIRIQSRVITNPQDAKAIFLALKENIERYELQYGDIPLPKTQPKPKSERVH